MKKLLLRIITFYCLILFGYSGFSQGIEENSLQFAPTEDPCSSAQFNVTYNNSNYNVLNLDCPENSKIDLSILFKSSIWCDFSFCNYSYEIYVEGNKILTGYLNSLANKTDINIDPDLIVKHVREKITNITVKIYKHCPNNITTSTYLQYEYSYPLQTINSNDYYYVYEYVGKDQEAFCEVEAGQVDDICCNPDLKKVYKIKNIVIQEISGEGKFKITGQVNTNKSIWSLGGILEGGGGVKYIISNQKETEISYTIQGKEGVCVTLGFQFLFDVYHKKFYKADCDLNNSNDEFLYLETEYRYLTTFPYTCNYNPYNTCNPPRPTFKQSGNRFDLNENCLGSIWIEELNNGESIDDVHIEWMNENGQTFSGSSINNAPYGKYTVKITNKCCQEFTEEVFLCPHIQQGNWLFNGLQWCREIFCEEQPAFRSGDCSFTECVIADDIEIFYENGKCRERHFYKGDLLGIAEVNDQDAERETEYDDFWNQCVYKYYCNGESTPEEIVEQDPDEEEWEFDEFFLECKLNVLCDEEWYYNVQSEDAEIEWEWDDFFNECLSESISCGGNIINEKISTDPYQTGNWEWSLGICEREVICGENNTTFIDNGEFDYEYVSQDEDCDGNNGYYDIFCDGEFVEQICSPDPNSNIFRNRVDEPLLVKIFKFENKIDIKVNSDSEENIIVQLYDLNGRLLKVVNSNYSINKISIDISDLYANNFIVTVKQGKDLISKHLINNR